MKKVRSNILSFLILASIVLACKDNPEPQPDWASKFVGTYSLEPSESAPQVLSGNQFYYFYNCCQWGYLTLVAVLDRVDNTHLTINLIIKHYNSYWTTQRITPFPPIKFLSRSVRAIDANTLLIEEPSLVGNTGKTMFKMDTINQNYPDSSKFKSLFFGIKQIGDTLTKGFTIKKQFDDAKFRAFFHTITIDKFQTHQRYFFALTNGVKYEWDFGDGGTSTEEDPFHVYKQNGNYKVRFSVTDLSGNKATTEYIQGVGNLPL